MAKLRRIEGRDNRLGSQDKTLAGKVLAHRATPDNVVPGRVAAISDVAGEEAVPTYSLSKRSVSQQP